MRTDEQKRIGAIKHYEKYESLAQSMGIESLKRMVPYDKETLANGHNSGDVHFNDCTKLINWDLCHGSVSMLARSPWSLCDTVCVLKHVARYYIVGVEIPEDIE